MGRKAQRVGGLGGQSRGCWAVICLTLAHRLEGRAWRLDGAPGCWLLRANFVTMLPNFSDSVSLLVSFLNVAAKSLQSCLTLRDPRDGSPPGSPVPGILQARTLEWVAIAFSNAWKWKVKVKSLSRVRLLATPWTAAYQAPPSMGFSRQVRVPQKQSPREGFRHVWSTTGPSGGEWGQRVQKQQQLMRSRPGSALPDPRGRSAAETTASVSPWSNILGNDSGRGISSLERGLPFSWGQFSFF